MASVDTDALDLLQRIFLVCDGTLTDTLQAAVQEPIDLVKLANESNSTAVPIENLSLQPGESVLNRRILLRGRQTERCYVYAESLVALDRVPSRFRDQLMSSEEPMGRLWSASKLESRKELLGVSQAPAGWLAEHFGSADDSPILTRSYRLISGGTPIMVISESFPASYNLQSGVMRLEHGRALHALGHNGDQTHE